MQRGQPRTHPSPTRRSTARVVEGPAQVPPSCPCPPPLAGQAQPGGAQARQKRQRRITRGGKAASRAASPPPAPPTAGNNGAAAAAAAEPALAAQQHAEAPNLDAWRDYFFPQQPALWAFALSFMPAQTMATMQRLHPSVVFPEHYPDRLPPGLGLELVPGAGPLPQLRPAVAAQPAPAAAAVAQQQQRQGQQQQGQQGHQQDQGPSCAAAASDAPLSEAPSSSSQLSDSLLSESSGGTLCMCAECCGGYGISGGFSGGCDAYCSSTGCYCSDGYCSTSPDDRMQPGKRIMWRGAIEHSGGCCCCTGRVLWVLWGAALQGFFGAELHGEQPHLGARAFMLLAPQNHGSGLGWPAPQHPSCGRHPTCCALPSPLLQTLCGATSSRC